MNDATLDAAGARTSFAAILGLLGCVAIVAGWFLPWATLTDQVRNAVEIDRTKLEEIDRELAAKGEDEAMRTAIRKLLQNEAINGRDWVAIVDRYAMRAEAMTPQEQRAWHVAAWILRLLPWVAGALGLWILLARLRPLPAVLLGLLLAVGFVIVGFFALALLGASQSGRESLEKDPLGLGVGIYAIAIGGALATVAGLFGVRRTTWWKAYLLAIVLCIGFVLGIAAYVRP